MFHQPKSTGQQPGLEVVVNYSDLEVPVSSGPESRYSKQHGLHPVPPERPKSWLRRQIARKRVIAAIVVVLVLAAVGIALGLTVGKKQSATPVSKPVTTSTQDKDPTSSGTATATKFPVPSDAPLAVVTSGKLYFQAATGDIVQSTLANNTQKVLKPTVPAKNATSLASVEWDDGKEIRVFYLSEDNKIQEYAYSGGVWSEGPLSSANFQAYSQSQLATTWFKSKGQLRLYYQLSNGTIQELSYSISGNNRGWVNLPSEFLPDAKLGSGLAATTFLHDQLRIYYQTEDYMVRESAWPKKLVWTNDNDNNNTWVATNTFTQTSNTGTQAHQRAIGLTTLATIRWESSTTPQLHCFYQAEDGSIIDQRWDDNDSKWIEVPMASDVKTVADKGKFSASIKDDNITFYYRANDGVREMVWTPASDWTSGSEVVLVPGS